MAQPVQRIGVLTGGGDCPGLNAVIRAVVKTALYRHGISAVGFLDGYAGLVEDRTVELTSDAVSGILTQGGTILGSSNMDNPFEWNSGADAGGKPIKQDRSTDAAAVYAKHKLDALVCIGGDGTLSIAGRLAAARGLRVVGVPKTIDNDIAETDLTFGFATAVNTATEAIDKIHTTAMSHHRAMIVEVMGRYAGWIALYAGAASGSDAILLPEIPYKVDVVADFCKARSKRGKRFSIICIAEGAKPEGGELTVSRVESRSHDPVRLGGVGNRLAAELRDIAGLDSRATILGHVQRGGTPVPMDRALATQLGHHAMTLLLSGKPNMMAAWRNNTVTEVPIEKVVNRQRLVPLDHQLIAAARAVGTCFGDAPVNWKDDK